MNQNTTTPPNNTISALFPLKPNLHLVDMVAAAGYNIFVYPKEGRILFEGDTNTVAHAMEVFTGGARAY